MIKLKSALLVLLTLPFALAACYSENPTSQSSDSSASTSQEEGPSQPCFYDEQGLAFYPKDDGTYAVHIGQAGLLSKIIIPDTFKGRGVTEIKSDFSYYINDIALFKSVTVPASITKIGNYAFRFNKHEYSGKTYCLEEFNYLGSIEQFSKIEFAELWSSPHNGYSQDLKLSFVDKEFKISEAYNSLCLSINKKLFYNGDTYNVYLGTSYPSIECYIHSSYNFLNDFRLDKYLCASSDTDVVSDKLEASSAGTASFIVTDANTNITMTLNIVSGMLQNFPDDIYMENEIFDFDGNSHSPVKPIHNLPDDVYVYYGLTPTSGSYQLLDQYYNSKTVSHPNSRSAIGQEIVRACLFKPGYDLKFITSFLVVNHKAMNDYVYGMSQNNHLYIHFLNANYNNYFVETCNVMADYSTYAKFDFVGVGTYGGAYVDIDLSAIYDGGWNEASETYGGSDVTVCFGPNARFGIVEKDSFDYIIRDYLEDIYSIPLSNGGVAHHFFISGGGSHSYQITLYPVG